MKREYYTVPNRNLKFVELEFDPRFIFYEDGKIFNRKTNRFLTPSIQPSTGKQFYLLTIEEKNKKTRKCITIENYLREYFLDNPPRIEGIECKEMKRYEGLYYIYRDGRVWSMASVKWMTACKNQRGYMLYCLLDKNGKRNTEYMHRLIAQNFIINGSIEGLQVHHQDKEVGNNTIQNLAAMTHKEHLKEHPRTGSSMEAAHEKRRQMGEQKRRLKEQQRLEIQKEKEQFKQELNQLKQAKIAKREKAKATKLKKAQARAAKRAQKQAEKEEREQYKNSTGKRMYKHKQQFIEKQKQREQLIEQQKLQRQELRKQAGYKIYEHTPQFYEKKKKHKQN